MKRIKLKLGGLHADHLRIAWGAGRVAIFLLLGKVVGAIKEMAIAYRYGISDVVDAYQFTMVLALWLPATLVGVISIVLIPLLVQGRKDDSERKSLAGFIAEFNTVVLIVGLILGLASFLLWPAVLNVAGQALPSSVQAMSQELMGAFSPAILMVLAAGVAGARLRAYERHINTLLDSLPALCILLAVLMFDASHGIAPLLWGTLIGYAIQSLWQSWLAGRVDGAGLRLAASLKARQWPGLAQAAGFMLLGQIAMSVVGPLDQYTAAGLGNNTNATLGYASRLLALILGVGAASVGRAALPVLADIQSRGNPQRARTMALKWAFAMTLIGALIALLAGALTPWGVSLLFERGAFTAQDTQVVSTVVRWGLLQLPFYFGVLVLVQLLASQRRYGLMAGIAFLNFLAKAAMNFYLAPRMGASGIMLATAIMYAVSMACYCLLACMRLPELGNRADQTE